MKTLLGILAFALLVLAAPTGGAQGAGIIRGFVRDSAGRPIPFAEISTHGTVARSGERGAFTLPGLPAGKTSVSVRAIGYQPAEQLVDVAAGAPTELNVVLSRLAELDTVRVTGRPPACDERTTLTGFNCRRMQGTGIFIDRLAIERAKPIYLADVFWDLPGFKVDPVERHRRAFRSTDGLGCTKFLENGRPLVFGMPRPQDILAIEIYRTYKDTPQIYRVFAWADPPLPATTCAIVNFWRKGSNPR